MSTVDDVLSVALALSPKGRGSIAGRLLSSLETMPCENAAIDEIWAKEIMARSAAYARGELKAQPWREALDEVRGRVAEKANQ
jgi:hypothetical protein